MQRELMRNWPKAQTCHYLHMQSILSPSGPTLQFPGAESVSPMSPYPLFSEGLTNIPLKGRGRWGLISPLEEVCDLSVLTRLMTSLFEKHDQQCLRDKHIQEKENAMQKGRWWGHHGGGIEAERKGVEKWDAEKERREEIQREGTQRKSGEKEIQMEGEISKCVRETGEHMHAHRNFKWKAHQYQKDTWRETEGRQRSRWRGSPVMETLPALFPLFQEEHVIVKKNHGLKSLLFLKVFLF